VKLPAVFNRITGLLTKPLNPRNYVGWWWNRTPAGVRVAPEDAFQISVFWGCIQAIFIAIAPSPWQIFQRLPNGNRDLMADDPLGYLLNVRPNTEMTAMAFKEALLIAALSWGNGYAEIVRTAGKVTALYPITPDRVTPWRYENGDLAYRVQNDDGSVVFLDPMDVFHLRGPGITGLIGDNVVSKAVHALGLAIAAERYGETYFGNNTEIGGVLETPNKLDDATYNRLKTAWDERHQGPHRAFRPAILDNGLKWSVTTTKAKDAQLLEVRQFQVEEICRWFGVPPHKVQSLQRATNNNIEHQGIEFARDALTPWKKRLEQEADFKLFSSRGPARFSLIDIGWTLQGDFASRAGGYQIMRNMGAFSVNDILKLEGRDTIGPDGDIRVVNSANIKLEDVGENYTLTTDDDSSSTPATDDNDTTSTGKGQDESGAEEIISDSFRIMFQSIYERVDKRRFNRRADLERHAKSDDDIDTAMTVFADAQEEFLSDSLALPCSAFNKAVKAKTFEPALSIGRKVINGEMSPDVAALDLVAAFLRKQ
jgi:HK97 family phage portal protein